MNFKPTNEIQNDQGKKYSAFEDLYDGTKENS